MSASSASPASASPSSSPASSTPSSTSSYSTATSQLTTIYTPPPSCKSRLYTSESESSNVLIVSHSVADEAACYPPSYGGQTEHILYSPGVCPAGWTAQSSGTTDGVQFSTCCPRGMNPIAGYECASWISSGATIALNAHTNTTITAPALAFEWYVSVRWASSNLSLFSPRSAPLLTTTSMSYPSSITPAAPSRPTAPAAFTSPATSHHKSGGDNSLSTGAIAGAAVGAAIVFLLIIACFILSARKRKDRHTTEINIYASAPRSHDTQGTYPAENRSSHAHGSPNAQMAQSLQSARGGGV